MNGYGSQRRMVILGYPNTNMRVIFKDSKGERERKVSLEFLSL